MWELQPLSNNRRTTEVSLLLWENTSLTLSQIPHNFVGLLSLHSLFFFSNLVCKISLKALPIYRQEWGYNGHKFRRNICLTTHPPLTNYNSSPTKIPSIMPTNQMALQHQCCINSFPRQMLLKLTTWNPVSFDVLKLDELLNCDWFLFGQNIVAS